MMWSDNEYALDEEAAVMDAGWDRRMSDARSVYEKFNADEGADAPKEGEAT